MKDKKEKLEISAVEDGVLVYHLEKIPHLAEAIDQMEAFVNKEKDKRRKVWAKCILESMRRVCWDLEKYEVKHGHRD